MYIYIVEDDLSVISVLRNIIEDHDLGTVCGDSGGNPAELSNIKALNPDIILVDFLMPGKDGIQFIKEIRAAGCRAKCIMISQVSNKELIGKAYSAGVDFFINKPINYIEVKSVIQNIDKQIQDERTVENIRKMFMTELHQKPEPKRAENQRMRRVQYILSQLGMSGEKGCGDIVKVCQYLDDKDMTIAQISISQLCEKLSDNPKNMEQRIRRAIAAGMTNLAHLGIEDFMNETFTSYSGSLFPFEEIRMEMDYIREKRKSGGKVTIKKFIDSLMVIAEQDQS